MNIKFTQTNLYGEDWEGRICNLPENTVICKWGELSCKQEFYILWYPDVDETSFKTITNDGWNAGVSRVTNCMFGSYGFTLLRNVKLHNPDKYNIIDKVVFENSCPIFNNMYYEVYEKPNGIDVDDIKELLNDLGHIDEDKYKVFIDRFNNHKEKLIQVHKIVGLGSFWDGNFRTCLVGIKNGITFQHDYYMLQSEIKISRGYMDSIRGEGKKSITKNPEGYNRLYNMVKLYFN